VPQYTLSGIGKRYWRSFLPVWLFPIAFFLTPLLPGYSTHAEEYFFLLAFPLMLMCGYPALRRWREGGITFVQMFFWFAVVPFLIWTSIIVSLFGLAILTGAVHWKHDAV
jgi:hypothetical protein